MDYNTQREKLIMPEYGRNVQKMIGQVKEIEDKEKRTEQAKAVVNVMGLLNPQVREMPDYKHKLWDHMQVIADYSLDVDSPYPVPTKEEAVSRPEPIGIEKTPIRAACYGRNIQNMIDLVASKEEGEAKNEMIRTLAIYMRQQYLIWNKDNVADQTIFADMERLAQGRLKVPEGITLGPVNGEFSRPGMAVAKQGGFGGKKRNRKKKH